MARRFSSRSEFLYEHFIANLGKEPAPASLTAASIDSLRRGLHIIGQETRFDLFVLIQQTPGALTLDDLAGRLRLPREKVQYHLYYMLTHGLILAGSEAGRIAFRPNPSFTKAMSGLFGSV